MAAAEDFGMGDPPECMLANEKNIPFLHHRSAGSKIRDAPFLYYLFNFNELITLSLFIRHKKHEALMFLETLVKSNAEYANMTPEEKGKYRIENVNKFFVEQTRHVLEPYLHTDLLRLYKMDVKKRFYCNDFDAVGHLFRTLAFQIESCLMRHQFSGMLSQTLNSEVLIVYPNPNVINVVDPEVYYFRNGEELEEIEKVTFGEYHQGTYNHNVYGFWTFVFNFEVLKPTLLYTGTPMFGRPDFSVHYADLFPVIVSDIVSIFRAFDFQGGITYHGGNTQVDVPFFDLAEGVIMDALNAETACRRYQGLPKEVTMYTSTIFGKQEVPVLADLVKGQTFSEKPLRQLGRLPALPKEVFILHLLENLPEDYKEMADESIDLKIVDL